jgi:hypothetical protein
MDANNVIIALVICLAIAVVVLAILKPEIALALGLLVIAGAVIVKKV